MLYLTILLGLILGSFGSVLITRLSSEYDTESSSDHHRASQLWSTIAGRSRCPHCQTSLARYDLIPIFSQIAQKGKCRHCQVNISTLYLQTEIVSAIMCVVSYLFLGSHELAITSTSGILFTIILRLLGLIAIHDRHTQTLHLPLRIATLIITTALLVLFYPSSDSIVLVTGLMGIFGLIYRAARIYAQYQYDQTEGFGLGDVLLAPIIGGLLAVPLSHHEITLSTIDTLTMIFSYLVIASLATLLLFAISHLINNKKNSYTQQHGEAATIAFIPGMVIALVIMIAVAQYIPRLIY